MTDEYPFKSRKEVGYWCIMFLSVLSICITVIALGLRNDEPIYSTFHFHWNFTVLGLAGGIIFGFVGSLSSGYTFLTWKNKQPNYTEVNKD